jgi:hypothetical protein
LALFYLYFLAHVVSSLAYLTCLGLKDLVVTNQSSPQDVDSNSLQAKFALRLTVDGDKYLRNQDSRSRQHPDFPNSKFRYSCDNM